jgi:hypothetical protein
MYPKKIKKGDVIKVPESRWIELELPLKQGRTQYEIGEDFTIERDGELTVIGFLYEDSKYGSTKYISEVIVKYYHSDSPTSGIKCRNYAVFTLPYHEINSYSKRYQEIIDREKDRKEAIEQALKDFNNDDRRTV